MHNILFFLVYAAAVLGQLSDDLTTSIALAHGYVEGNPVGAWLMKKLGAGAVYGIKSGALPLILVALSIEIGDYASVGLAFLAAMGFAMGIRNYLLLRKAKISVF